MLIFIGIAFNAIGGGVLLASFNVDEVEVQYDEFCGYREICTIIFEVEDRMEGPIYFYYQLNNFYQNHRRFALSRNWD